MIRAWANPVLQEAAGACPTRWRVQRASSEDGRLRVIVRRVAAVPFWKQVTVEEFRTSKVKRRR